MNSSDLDQLLDHFNTKIQTIYSLIPLSKLYEEFNDKQNYNRNAVIDSNNYNCNNSDDSTKRIVHKKPDLREISQMVIEMKTMTQQIRQLLRQQKQSILTLSVEYHNDLDRIQRHCDHVNHNIPEFLQNNKPNKSDDKRNEVIKRPVIDPITGGSKVVPKANQRPKTAANQNMSSKSTHELTQKFGSKSVKKKVVKSVANVPNISFITTEEFDSIPQYMLQRLTYEVINRSIGDINRAIAAKYKIIFNYSNKYSDEEMRKYVKYKEQENSETDGQYFCTIEDFKALSDMKSDATIRKVIICLRHCKRIREIRGNPPKLVRYALITNQMDFN